MVQGLSGDDGAATCPTVRNAPDVWRDCRRPRARVRDRDARDGSRRSLSRIELRSRHPVDALRATGLPSAADRVDADLPRHRRRSHVGSRSMAHSENQALAAAARMRLAALLLAASLLVAVVSEARAGLRVFVTNEKSDDVTVIEAESGAVLKTLAVGKRPRGVTASADGKRVYVANSNSDSLSVIDAASLVVIATLPAGRDPEGLTFNRDGTLLYVVNENDSAVTVIDVASPRIVKKIQVGTEPETAVASPDGRWVAVSNETSNDIHVIDTASNTVTRSEERRVGKECRSRWSPYH